MVEFIECRQSIVGTSSCGERILKHELVASEARALMEREEIDIWCGGISWNQINIHVQLVLSPLIEPTPIIFLD